MLTVLCRFRGKGVELIPLRGLFFLLAGHSQQAASAPASFVSCHVIKPKKHISKRMCFFGFWNYASLSGQSFSLQGLFSVQGEGTGKFYGLNTTRSVAQVWRFQP